MRTLRAVYRAVTSQLILNRMLTAAARYAGASSNWFIDHLPRRGPVKVELPNGRELRLVAEEAEAVSNSIYWRGWNGHEPEMSQLFFEIAQHARGVVDVGAHVGYYSLLAMHANPRAEVFAFEPLPHVADRLEHHMLLNSSHGEVGLSAPDRKFHVIRAAAGETASVARLNYSMAIPVPSASTLDEAVDQGTPCVASILVPVTTVDSIVKEHRIDLMKIDTESTELDVLKGSVNVLSRDRPVVFCEVLVDSPTAHAMSTFFKHFSYNCALLTDSGPVLQDQVLPDRYWRNWMFTPM